jgi:hypothetical protein
MPAKSVKAKTFAVTDCALLSIATGQTAQNLRELRDRLGTIHAGSIYHHFWGRLLRAGFGEPEFNNDFANWAHQGLSDRSLAERLSVIDPSNYRDLEALRGELIEVIEERLFESEWVPWAKSEQAFRFVRSFIVVFDTGVRVNEPEHMVEVVSRLSNTSLYYHFIDARSRPPEGVDDLRAWLQGFGDRHSDLVARIADLDPYFLTLPALRDQLAAILVSYFDAVST